VKHTGGWGQPLPGAASLVIFKGAGFALSAQLSSSRTPTTSTK
jgi:hypothetical protein